MSLGGTEATGLVAAAPFNPAHAMLQVWSMVHAH